MNSEIFEFVNIIKALIPEGTAKSIKLDDIEYSISNKDGVISLTQKFDDCEIKEYVSKFKEGLQTNNANIIEMAQILKSRWDIQCDQARIDHYMSQNEWDEVLDAKTSWNRKQFGKSIKLYK